MKLNVVYSIEENKDQSYYTKVSTLARKKGVTVSVITMEGEDCSMENLGTVADITSGNVEIVDPLDLSSKVLSLLKKSILASNVIMKIFLHPDLQFKTDEKGVLNKLVREIGNVTEDTDITLSFDWNEEISKTLEKYANLGYQEKQEDKIVSSLLSKKYPFQVQLQYTKPDGGVFIKTLSSLMSVSGDRNAAEKDINTTIISLQTIHESARLAKDGKYNDARINLVSTLRMLQRTMKTAIHQKDYLNFVVQAEKLDQFMRENQALEAVLGAKDDKSKGRDDDAAKNLYQMKSVSVKSFRERK